MPFTEVEATAILEALRAGKTLDTEGHRNGFEFGWSDGSYWYRELQDFDWYPRYQTDEARIRQGMAQYEEAFRAFLNKQRGG